MAHYLITGGCGFIGSQLTHQLIQQGHDVIVVDDLSNGTIIHPQSTFIKADITRFDQLGDLFKGLDGCFHLAAKPTVSIDFEDWFTFHNTNLNGSLNVFKAAVTAGNVPVVYASSCGVYGNSKRLPLTEGQNIKPLSSYGCDKLSTELNASFLAYDYQLPSMGLRFFNVYGPYQQETSPYSGVITHFISKLLADKPLVIYGDGQQTRDFVFVGDVINNAIHAMKILKKGAHVANICTGNSVTVYKLAQLLSAMLEKKLVVDYTPPRRSDVKDSCGSQKKMNAYGFMVNHSLEQGLMKTIAYFKSL